MPVVALSKNVASSIGFFPWFFGRDDRAYFICSADWGDGCGILDFGLVDRVTFSRRYELGSDDIFFNDRVDRPALAKFANPLDVMVSGLGWVGNGFYES